MSGKNPDRPIGYGNPPDHTKFQPGKSGNPNGRPKQSKPYIDIRNLLRDELLRQVPLLVDGRQNIMSVIQIIVRRLATESMKGSVKSLAMIEKLMTGGFCLIRELEDHQNNASLAAIDALLEEADKWNA